MIKVPYIAKCQDYKKPEKSCSITLKSHNWDEEYPYSPFTKVRIWHTGDTLFLNYSVDEEFVTAKTDKDCGNVYKDSCVEFFLAFDSEGYYNIESNCIGRILMSHRKSRKENIEYASESVFRNIIRLSSLGESPFDLKENTKPWELTLKIPVSSFFKHKIPTLSGLKGKCNFYKCGDDLPRPHYMSWKPIFTEKPDFHRPEFFGEICFE